MKKIITTLSMLAAAALACHTHASVIINTSTSCSPLSGSGSGTWQDLETNGTVSSNCNASSAWASVDSDSATMKLYTNVVTTPDSVYNAAWANAAIYDTITLLSDQDYAQVALNLYFHFDATMAYSFPASSAVTTAPNARHLSLGALSRVMGAFLIEGDDYNAEPDNYEELYGRYRFNAEYDFNFQAGPFVSVNHPSAHWLTEWFNESRFESYELPDGRSSGFSVSQILTLPTNSALSLVYSINMSSICSLAALCDLTNDGSNTFTIGLSALDGTLVSGNGYGYLPASGAPTVVSAPATLGIFAVGLLLLGVRRVSR